MNIDHLQFLTVPVSDHVRARDFYVDTLGFDLIADHRGPHGQFVLVGPKGPRPGSFSSITRSAASNSAVSCIPTAYERRGRRCRRVARRRPFGRRPTTQPWGRITSFQDPDGNGIGLLEPSAYGNRPE